jgi:hypothetical protein
MIETRLKVIQPNDDISKDIYFEDASKWTFTKNGAALISKATLSNKDLLLKVQLKQVGGFAKAVANGVVLDPTKTYVITIKINSKDLDVSTLKVAGVDITGYAAGKEIIRKFKPINTTLDFRVDVVVPTTNPGILAGGRSNSVLIDYFKIIEYDVSYLDLLQTEPVLYQSNVKDIYEPDKIKSDYTKDFEIPGTPNNNRFFNHWYKISAKGDFDSTAKIPVTIQKQETDLIEGYMALNSVKLDRSKITYSVSIVAEMSNIWLDIDTKKLTDLNLSEYNHSMAMQKIFVDLPENGTVINGSSLNPTDVNTVWTYETEKTATSVDYLTLPNGSRRLRFYVTGHGYSEGDFVRISNYQTALPTKTILQHNVDCIVEAVFDANSFYVNVGETLDVPTGYTYKVKKKNFTGKGWFYGAVNRGHTTNNTMTPGKSRPQMFLKGILDKIFEESGYQYDSEFLNSNYFKSLCADILTKEITQTTENMQDNFCEVKSLLTGTINPISGQPDPVKFLKYAKLVATGNPVFPYTTSGDVMSYGKEYFYDLQFNTVIDDEQNLFGSGNSTFNPKATGQYKFSINLTVGMTIVNNSPGPQYVLPEAQTFKEKSYCSYCPFDFQYDGTPKNTLYVYNNKDAQENSGIIYKLQVVDESDNVLWTSARTTVSVSNRGLGYYQFTDATGDFSQQVALFLQKNKSYRLRLSYTRNQKYCLGSEPNKTQPWKYGIGGRTTDALGNYVYFTKFTSANTQGVNNFSAWIVGNNETTNLVTGNPDGGQIWGGQKTGAYYCKFELLSSVSEGSDIFVKNFIVDMEQKDFLSSINKMFNLYWYWDRNNNRYKIEPFYGFYNQTELDWTSKVDLSKDIEMKPLDNDKKYILSYKNANDYYNDDYNKAFGSGYGDSIVLNSSEIATGDNKIECGFSLGVLVGFPKTPYNSMVMPTYTSAAMTINNSTNNDNSENVRVYICGGKKYTSTPMLLDDQAATVKQAYEGIKYNYYPFIGHIDDTFAPYYDLCYSNPAQFSYITANYTTHNLYNKFWRDWFNLILNKEQKLVSYYINLNDSDIFNLDYSKRYVINKEPFRLISVADHNLTANNLAVVTFVKDFGSKQFKPKTITNAGGNKPWWKDKEDIYTDFPWSNDYPWVGGGHAEFNPGTSYYNAVISHTVQSTQFRDFSSMSDGQSDFGVNLNGTGASAFQSVNLGVYNRDFGSENFITGNNNRVYSSNNFVSGVNNEVFVQNAIVMGDNLRVNVPGIYLGDTYIAPNGVVHNATNVINGGVGETTGYFETVSNLYKPNVIGLISGSGSTTNRYAGVLEMYNPHIQFQKLNGYDIRHDRPDTSNSY